MHESAPSHLEEALPGREQEDLLHPRVHHVLLDPRDALAERLVRDVFDLHVGLHDRFSTVSQS